MTSPSPESGIDRPPSPRLLRFGIVPYLNVQPLIWAFQNAEQRGHSGLPEVEITAEHPRLLAESFRDGRYDAAIVPVFEYLRHPDSRIVPGVSIACRGAVYSVVLFADSPINQVRTIYLDPASLTSVNLMKVLAAELGMDVEFLAPLPSPSDSSLPPGTGRLLIGDPAMSRRGRHAFEYDLGKLWQNLTGLPFVFAAWLAAPGAADLPVAATLQLASRIGRANLDQVALETASRFGFSPENALRYFRENMCYDLGEQELAGIREFARLSVKHGLIARVPEFRFQER